MNVTLFAGTFLVPTEFQIPVFCVHLPQKELITVVIIFQPFLFHSGSLCRRGALSYFLEIAEVYSCCSHFQFTDLSLFSDRCAGCQACVVFLQQGPRPRLWLPLDGGRGDTDGGDKKRWCDDCSLGLVHTVAFRRHHDPWS